MVREATELDLLKLMELGRDYALEANYHDSLPYDEEFAVNSAINSLLHPNYNIFVAVHEGEVVGFLWGSVSPMPWSPALIAIDNILYIKPEHRGRILGVRLIKAYEEWAIGMGAKQVSISIASGLNEDKTCKLYERLGYHSVGRQYRKEV